MDGPNIGPTWAQDGPNIAQHRPNLGQYRPKMGPAWLNMGPNWPNISPRCAQDGSTAQPALNIGPDCFHTGKHCALIMLASVQHSPPWVCAENLGPFFPHHTPKVGRPPVRRKPLNPGAGHEASPCPCRRPSVVYPKVIGAAGPAADPPPTHPWTTPGQLKSL